MSNRNDTNDRIATHERAIEQATDGQRFAAWIDGSTHDAETGRTFETRDPTTGTPITAIPRCSEPEVDAAIEAARVAFEDAWGPSHTRSGLADYWSGPTN